MYGKFLVEGDKSVRELLHSAVKIDAIYGLSDWIERHHTQDVELHIVSPAELAEISTHEQPDEVVAVAAIPGPTSGLLSPTGLYIACDRLNDPGNAGTIIRIADWFGAAGVIFSDHSVEVYNPKVVSAAKGSLFRMQVIYADLATLLRDNKELPVLGTYMDGESIYSTRLPASGILLIGNEANGIGEELSGLVSKRISIPSFGQAESLNAGVATGILMSEWRRQWI